MTHLNTCLGNLNDLRHQVLVCHLKIFVLGLLVLGADRGKGAHLESVRNIIMTGASERSWRALLIEHLDSVLLLRGRRSTICVVAGHEHLSGLLTTKIALEGPVIHAADHCRVVELVPLVLHHVHQLVLRQPVVDLVARLG